ncbi:hypothetical protein [Thalassoroseus pseudoceratinae]|uniref:hypothetical protein n=1 Tax=Thalassoroseus pseudoceratinae TaxID=2713176 RepID=UPI00141E878A|nr:hypothetical protein [Thalassoroseus pseudoceratinae]
MPTRSTHISLNGLPRTFSLIDQVRDVSGTGRPAVLGLLLNATNKTHQQYRSIVKPVVEASTDGSLPPFFGNREGTIRLHAATARANQDRHGYIRCGGVVTVQIPDHHTRHRRD